MQALLSVGSWWDLGWSAWNSPVSQGDPHGFCSSPGLHMPAHVIRARSGVHLGHGGPARDPRIFKIWVSLTMSIFRSARSAGFLIRLQVPGGGREEKQAVSAEGRSLHPSALGRLDRGGEGPHCTLWCESRMPGPGGKGEGLGPGQEGKGQRVGKPQAAACSEA